MSSQCRLSITASARINSNMYAVPSSADRIRRLKEEYGQMIRINSAAKGQGSDQCCQNRETAEMQYTKRDFKMYYPNPGQFFMLSAGCPPTGNFTVPK